MTDTHTHIYTPDFEGNGEAAYLRAREAGVDMMVLPNCNEESAPQILDLYSRHPDNIRMAFGIHPTDLPEDWLPAVDRMLGLLEHSGCVAVGEVGIDLHWEQHTLERQMQAFEYQLRYAAKSGLPVIIHQRDALTPTLDVISRLGADRPKTLFHSFTGSPGDARAILDAVPEAMFGINGVVTFKNAKPLQQAVPMLGIDRIVLETDSPYLSPVPFRGQLNESARIPVILAKVAELTGLTPAEAEAATDANARRLFRF